MARSWASRWTAGSPACSVLPLRRRHAAAVRAGRGGERPQGAGARRQRPGPCLLRRGRGRARWLAGAPGRARRRDRAGAAGRAAAARSISATRPATAWSWRRPGSGACPRPGGRRHDRGAARAGQAQHGSGPSAAPRRVKPRRRRSRCASSPISSAPGAISPSAARRVLGEAPSSWRPFLLNPYLPPDGVARSRYLERKFGSLAQAQTPPPHAPGARAADGIRFAFGAIRTQPNTMLAHAAGAGRRRAGRARAWSRRGLFRAFFEEGATSATGDLARRSPSRRCAVARPRLSRRSGCGRAGGGQRSRAAAGSASTACRFSSATDHVIAGAQPTEALAALIDLERYRRAVGRSLSAQGRQAS